MGAFACAICGFATRHGGLRAARSHGRACWVRVLVPWNMACCGYAAAAVRRQCVDWGVQCSALALGLARRAASVARIRRTRTLRPVDTPLSLLESHTDLLCGDNYSMSHTVMYDNAGRPFL